DPTLQAAEQALRDAQAEHPRRATATAATAATTTTTPTVAAVRHRPPEAAAAAAAAAVVESRSAWYENCLAADGLDSGEWKDGGAAGCGVLDAEGRRAAECAHAGCELGAVLSRHAGRRVRNVPVATMGTCMASAPRNATMQQTRALTLFLFRC